MSEHMDASLSEALLAHRAALRRVANSGVLDARFEQSLVSWSSQGVRASRRRRLTWAFAATAVAVLVTSTGWLVMHVDASRPPAGMRNIARAPVADTAATVLRMRASLGTQLPVRN